ncbi:hypothetical protein AB0M87_17100 [Streptomyces sp. NPDC051320]|uniref:hypothetical protein n=1 Tax=Streptomyces sp. NPDC051320 TaxID=3154644 RepID=UPI00342FF4D9
MLPLIFGLFFGLYSAYIENFGSLSTGEIVLSVVFGVAVAVLTFVFGRVQYALPRELRAAGYGVLFGGIIGFTYSLTGHSVLLSSFIGFFLGAGMLLAAFYLIYTHED